MIQPRGKFRLNLMVKKFTKTGQNWFGNVIGVNRLNEAGYIYLITIHTKILMSKKLTK